MVRTHSSMVSRSSLTFDAFMNGTIQCKMLTDIINPKKPHSTFVGNGR